MPSALQEREFQLAQAGIRVAVEGRLSAAITSMAERGYSDPRGFRNAVIGITQLMVREYGQAAGEFAAEWYNDVRLSEGVRGNFTAAAAVQSFDEAIDQTVRRSVASLFTDAPDLSEVIRAVTSKAAQYTVDGARNTVRSNAIRDPQASGWKRIAHGETCDFCLMLVGRGGVYKRETVTFKSHAGCNCTAAPSWDPDASEVPTIAYRASSRRGSSTAAVRAWIAEHRSELDDLRASLST